MCVGELMQSTIFDTVLLIVCRRGQGCFLAEARAKSQALQMSLVRDISLDEAHYARGHQQMPTTLGATSAWNNVDLARAHHVFY